LIALTSASNISLAGTVEARAGSGGAGPTVSGGGDGGNGAIGVIILRDPDGTVAGTLPTQPSATISVLPALGKAQFNSDFACGSIKNVERKSDLFLILLTLLFGSMLPLFFKRQSA
jgi:hypothetical protein